MSERVREARSPTRSAVKDQWVRGCRCLSDPAMAFRSLYPRSSSNDPKQQTRPPTHIPVVLHIEHGYLLDSPLAELFLPLDQHPHHTSTVRRAQNRFARFTCDIECHARPYVVRFTALLCRDLVEDGIRWWVVDAQAENVPDWRWSDGH